MILCCGEALIDMVPVKTPDGTAFHPHAGGAIFNTAIALGRLGARTAMLTGLSSDLFGQQLSMALTESKVDTALVVTTDRPTTLAFVHLVDGHATYNFFDENSAGRMLEVAELPQIPDEVQTLYFGGISLACEPSADTYASLMAQQAARKVIFIDPNIRTTFIKDEDRYRARMANMLKLADIVKVSDEDLHWLVEGPLSLGEKAEQLMDAGPALVIVTLGSQGAMAISASGVEVSVPAPKIEVVDTVGAGDTFNAGVLAKLAELDVLRKENLLRLSADTLEAALQNGANVAAVTVSRSGANPPWSHEL